MGSNSSQNRCAWRWQRRGVMPPSKDSATTTSSSNISAGALLRKVRLHLPATLCGIPRFQDCGTRLTLASDASTSQDKRRAAEALEDQKRLKRAGAAQDVASRPAKPVRGAGLKPSQPTAAAVVPDEYLPPNKILFVQN